jgi:head-tail adaptor
MPFGQTIQHRTPTLQAGKLRHRISIVSTSPAQDTTGGFDLNATTLYAGVWATVEALSGMEQFATESQVSKVTHQIVIRYVKAAPSWKPNTNYLTGALVSDANGNLQVATYGGLSGATAPGWATGLYAFTSDGNPSTGLQWQNLGPCPVRSGVNAAMQIVWQGRKFQITAVLNSDARSKLLVLLADEINDSNQQNPIVGGTAAGAGVGTIIDGGTF